MTVSLKRKFVSNVSDDDSVPNSVRPSNWNDEHDLTGTANAFLGFDGDGATVEIPLLTFDTDGNLTIGGYANAPIDYTESQFQIAHDGGGTWRFNQSWIGFNNFAPVIAFGRTNGSTPDAHVTVTADQALGGMYAYGDDGTAMVQSTAIRSFVDGTVTANSVPGRISFWTTNNSVTSVSEKWRIDQAGRLIKGGVSSLNTSYGANIEVHENRQYWFAGATFANWSSRTGAWTDYPALQFHRSWSGTIGTHVAPSAGVNNVLVEITAAGSDGIDFQPVFDMVVQVDGGAIGSPTFLPGRLSFSLSDNVTGALKERFRIDSGGTITNGAVPVNTLWDYLPNIEFQWDDNARKNIAFHTFNTTSSSAGAPSLLVCKSNHVTKGTHGAVAAEHCLMNMEYAGSDGTSFKLAAAFRAWCDGTVSTGIVPGRLCFYTTNSAGTSYERMRIINSGEIGIGMIPTIALYSSLPQLSVLNLHALSRWTTDVGGPQFNFTKSRGGGTVGNHGAVVSGDVMMNIAAGGSDGTDFGSDSVVLKGIVDGSVATDSVPGKLCIYTAPAGTTLSLERLTVRSAGDVVVGKANGALATNATVGFFHMPGCAGIPSGAPANLETGIVPLVIDTTNSRIYGYWSSAWHQLT